MREVFLWVLSLFLITGSVMAVIYFIANVRRK